MENPNKAAAEQENKILAEFDATPREQLEEFVNELMTEQEQAELMTGEMDLILRIARKQIASKENPPSVHDAIVDATVIRVGVKGFSRFVVQDSEGNVIASDANKMDAIRKGREMSDK